MKISFSIQNLSIDEDNEFVFLSEAYHCRDYIFLEKFATECADHGIRD